MPIKGVIVAAGYGTRFLPITKCVPKEMLPLIDRPAVDFVVEEFRAAGIDELLLISSRRKKSLEDWFDRESEMESVFRAEGAEAKLAKIQPPDMRVQVVRQHEMRGTGDALLCAKTFAGSDPVVVAFPDDIFPTNDGSPNCTAELIRQYRTTQSSVIAMADYTGRDVSAYGVLDVESTSAGMRVRAVVEKPPKGQEPSAWISLGRYLYTPEMFELLAQGAAQHEDGEFYPMDALNQLARNGALFAVHYAGERWDTGHAAGYLEAILAEAHRRPELARVLRAWTAKHLT